MNAVYVYMPYMWINLTYETGCDYLWIEDVINVLHTAGLQTSVHVKEDPGCHPTLTVDTFNDNIVVSQQTIRIFIGYHKIVAKSNYLEVCFVTNGATCTVYTTGNYRRKSLKNVEDYATIAFAYNVSHAFYMKPVGNSLYEFCEAGYVSKLMSQILEKYECRYQSLLFQDMGVAPFVLPITAVVYRNSSKEEGTVAYSPIISSRSVVFYVRAPRPLDKTHAFIAPFELLLWISLFGCIIVLTVVLYVIAYCGGKIQRKRTPSVLDIFFALIQTGLRQDLVIEALPGAAIALSMLIWIIAIFILTSSYSGTILSFLSIPAFEPVVETFKELGEAIQAGRYSCGTVDDYAIKDFLNASKTGLWKILRDSMLSSTEKNIVFDVEEGLKQVLERNYAFISYDLFTKPVTMSLGEEKFFASRDSLFTSYAAMSFHRVFQYRHEFERMISLYQQGGLIDKFYNDEIEDLRRVGAFYAEVESNEHRPLVLSDFIPPFYLLAGGYIISTVVFLVELFIGKSNKI